MQPSAQQPLLGQADELQRLLRPLLYVLGGVALGLARDQPDQRLLHDPCLRDAVRVDAEEAHAALRPQVAGDARLDARLDEAHNEVTPERLAAMPEQGEVILDSRAAREFVAETCLAQFEDPREECPKLLVLDDRLCSCACVL